MTLTTLSQIAALSLNELQQSEKFSNRHLGPDNIERADMLKALGLASLDDLIDKVVPDQFDALMK